MTKIFYWQLIELTPFRNELINRGVGESDLAEILEHVEEIIHHRTLNLVFDRLPPEHHREFSLNLAKNPQSQEMWGFLQEKTKMDLSPVIEQNIRSIILEILNEFEFDKS